MWCRRSSAGGVGIFGAHEQQQWSMPDQLKPSHSLTRYPLWIWRSSDRVILAGGSKLPPLAATGVSSRFVSIALFSCDSLAMVQLQIFLLIPIINCQVVNHGVSMELVQKFRKQALDVFALPPEQKDTVSRRRSGGSQWGYDFRPDHGPLEVFQMNAWDHQQLLDYSQRLFPNSSENFV